MTPDGKAGFAGMALRLARNAGLGAAALSLLLMLARLVASSALVREGAFLDGMEYLPPWPLVVLVVPIALACWALRQRRVAMLLATTALLLFMLEEDLSVGPRPQPPPPGAPELKVATINVQYYRAGREAVVQAIKDMNADVVLLGENDVLTEEVPELQRLFEPLHFYPGRREETAIVSRTPVRDVKEVELPSFQASLYRRNRLEDQSGHPRRSFVHAQLDVSGVLVHVMSVRFIAGRPPSRTLRDQLAWGRYLVKTHHQEGRFFVDYLSRLRGPIVFGGDLNAPPSAKLIRSLSEVAEDAYLATHWWGRPTFEMDRPLLRLDYLFGMNGAVAVESSRLPRRVSDHHPVWARFVVSPSNANGAMSTP
jgi:endonuclease/exonuclease/phosphatase (EEP) superfamily protein YafD